MFVYVASWSRICLLCKGYPPENKKIYSPRPYKLHVVLNWLHWCHLEAQKQWKAWQNQERENPKHLHFMTRYYPIYRCFQLIFGAPDYLLITWCDSIIYRTTCQPRFTCLQLSSVSFMHKICTHIAQIVECLVLGWACLVTSTRIHMPKISGYQAVGQVRCPDRIVGCYPCDRLCN